MDDLDGLFDDEAIDKLAEGIQFDVPEMGEDEINNIAGQDEAN